MNDVRTDWQPSCTLQMLRLRAQMLSKIRQFFAVREVLEVETPVLCQATGTDPHLDFFATDYDLSVKQPLTLYLQTSPEFAMKRLLAAGSGSIYQIGKAFRNGESGRFHNPEFTILEWYRVGYDLSALMIEIDVLITYLFADIRVLQATQKVSYQQIFQDYTGLNPLVFAYDDYVAYAAENGLIDAQAVCGLEHAAWLDFIFSHQIQPHLGHNALCMVYGYPACMPSLARLNADNPLVSERVELFIDGVELGNGFHELCDVTEQRQRFDHEIALRKAKQRPQVARDERFLAALTSGLSDCSGIAIGLDRLLMLQSGCSTIDDVLAFSISRA